MAHHRSYHGNKSTSQVLPKIWQIVIEYLHFRQVTSILAICRFNLHRPRHLYIKSYEKFNYYHSDSMQYVYIKYVYILIKMISKYICEGGF